MTYLDVLKSAVIAGSIAGLLGAAYLVLVTEPLIGDAVALEEQVVTSDAGDARHPTDGEQRAELGRPVQVAGGVAAAVILSIIVASVFGTVYAGFRHRLPGQTDLLRAMWLAAIGFGTISLLPGIKYPATPPAVGNPATIDQRTIHWVVLVVLGLFIACGLTKLSSLLRSRIDDATRMVAVAVATFVAYSLLLAGLPPTPDTIPREVPAALVWEFRVVSLGGLALLWLTLGLGTGWLIEREVRE